MQVSSRSTVYAEVAVTTLFDLFYTDSVRRAVRNKVGKDGVSPIGPDRGAFHRLCKRGKGLPRRQRAPEKVRKY